MSKIIIILAQGYSRNMIGQITATILRTVKKYQEVLENRSIWRKLILKKSFAIRFTKLTEKSLWWSPFFLKSQPMTELKISPSQVFLYDFCKVFQNSYSIEGWRIAFSKGITYKTKTGWKAPIDHKNTITFQINKNSRRRLNFFTVAPILKPVFSEVTNKI